MSLSKYILLTSFSAITMMHSTLSMEAQTKVTWSEEQKITSAASSYAYDVTSNTIDTRENLPLSLSSYNVIKSRFATADEGTIQAVTLYDPKKNTAIISFRGTKEARDWKANLGIGYCIAQAIHQTDYLTDGKPTRLPNYFSSLATRKLKGLFGDNFNQLVMSNLDLPLNSFLDSMVTFHPFKDIAIEALHSTGVHAGSGILVATPSCAVAGSIIPGAGTLAGSLVGLGAGLIYGGGAAIVNGIIVAKESYKVMTDYKYERELHLDAISRIVDLSFLKQYTIDSSDFLRTSIETILNENEHDQDPTINITGHSLGRFLSGSAFLDCLGSRNTHETNIRLERIASMRNIGFNGPAGFQGLPYLPFMEGQAGQNVTTALRLLNDTNRSVVQHIRRQNDLVGSLAADFDISQTQVIEDVMKPEIFSAPTHFLNNHGIKPIFQLFHQ